MEPPSQLDEGGEPPPDTKAAARLVGDAREQLEDGAFARAVGPDDAQRFTFPDAETHILQRPELVLTRLVTISTRQPLQQRRDRVPQAVMRGAELVAFPDVVERNGVHRVHRVQEFKSNPQTSLRRA